MDAKDFISLNDFSAKDIRFLLQKTNYLKVDTKKHLEGKVLGLLFEKPSTRTRVSFEVAMLQLGGRALDLPFKQLQLSRGETIEDTARVLSRYVHGIVMRTYAHKTLLDFATAATVPVINGLTDLLHPCQTLADLYTIKQKLGKLYRKTLVYFGDADNNVTHSLMHGCSKVGMNMVISCPLQYYPNPRIMAEAQKNCKESKATLTIIKNPERAIQHADVVYTDTWVSMGEQESKKRIQLLKPYQVNAQLLKKTRNKVIVMHDLPAHRGYEITSEVMDGKQSVIFDQAENRLHVQKAILAELLG